MQYLSQRLAREPAKASEERQPDGPLAASQRERLLAAAARLIAERGCASASIEAIVKLAGVSSVTFYEHFANKESCFVAAFDWAVRELRDAAESQFRGGDGVEAALAALLAAIDADPQRARLCFVEAPKGGPVLRERYDAELDAVAAELSDPLAQAIVGAIAWLIHERLERGGGDGARDLLSTLTATVLDPYLVDA
jgi:AcrR family transcriptional regulator